MKALFAPTLCKIWFPLVLVALSLLPNFELRQIVFGALALPYSGAVGHPPFPFHDKPWFISPAGAFAVGFAWALIAYLVVCLVPRRKPKERETRSTKSQ